MARTSSRMGRTVPDRHRVQDCPAKAESVILGIRHPHDTVLEIATLNIISPAIDPPLCPGQHLYKTIDLIIETSMRKTHEFIYIGLNPIVMSLFVENME